VKNLTLKKGLVKTIMNNNKKKVLIVGIGLMIIGIAVMLVAFIGNGFSFYRLSISGNDEIFKNSGMVSGADTVVESENAYKKITCDNLDDFDEISVRVSEQNVKLIKTSEKPYVEMRLFVDSEVDINVKDNCLNISEKSDRNIGRILTLEETYINIYVNKEDFGGDVEINTASGDVTIPGEFSFVNGKFNSASGDIKVDAGISGVLRAYSTSGEIEIDNADARMIYAEATSGEISIANCNLKDSFESNSGIFITTTSGDVKTKNCNYPTFECSGVSAEVEVNDSEFDDSMSLESISGDITIRDTTTKKFSMTSTSGNCILDEFDATDMYINTISGEVGGKLKTSKDFEISTISGDRNVPKYKGTGKCKVITVSGDIDFTL